MYCILQCSVQVILQTIATGVKVLVCAPSNVAVDNLLERLLLYRSEEGVFLRVGQPARVAESLHGHTLDTAVRQRGERVEELRQRLVAIQGLLDMGSDGVTGEREELRKELEEVRQELGAASGDLEVARRSALLGAEVVLGTLASCGQEGALADMPRLKK